MDDTSGASPISMSASTTGVPEGLVASKDTGRLAVAGGVGDTAGNGTEGGGSESDGTRARKCPTQGGATSSVCKSWVMTRFVCEENWDFRTDEVFIVS